MMKKGERQMNKSFIKRLGKFIRPGMAAILGIFVLLCSFFTGCGAFSSKVNDVKLEGYYEIGQDGYVEKEVFEKLKEENAVATFRGENGDYRYEWTVFGSDIREPERLNLGLAFEKPDSGEDVRFTFCAENEFDFMPVLSIYLNRAWEAQDAVVYRKEGTELLPLCSASVTGSKNAILNFATSVPGGEIVIAAGQSSVDVAKVYVSEEGAAENGTKNVGNISNGAVSRQGNTSSGQSAQDPYLSQAGTQTGRIYSDGSATEKDQYLTDPVPEGKPMPVEPDAGNVDSRITYTCTFSIECSTIINNLEDLDPAKLEMVPADGIILASQTVTFYQGESVFDVLQRLCREKGIHMEASWTPIYNSAYVEGIHNLYEFDCGNLSGWMYRVNGWYPNYGCSRYQLEAGDVVEWRYTCDLGKDVGCDWLADS